MRHPSGLLEGEVFAVVFFFAFTAFVFTLPVFRNIDYWGIQDWDQAFFYHAVPRATILEYRQFPLWNPYYCGGTVLLARPQSQILTPLYALVLIFGVVVGIKIQVFLYLVVGLSGVYFLGRYYGMSKPAAVMSSLVFMLNSMYALIVAAGMPAFMPLAFIPWVFLYYLKSFRNLRYALLSGLFCLLMFFGGGLHPLIMTLTFILVYSCLSVLLREHGAVEVGKVLAVILIFMLCLGAVQFLPSIEFIIEHPRFTGDYSGFSLNSLKFSLLDRNQILSSGEKYEQKEGFLEGLSYNMDENGMYVGIIPLLLFMIGAASHYKRRRVLLLCFIILLWLGFGNRIPLSLWEQLHKLPLYNCLRVAQRFRFVFMLCLSVFAGLGFQAVENKISKVLSNKTAAGFIMLAILLVVLADLMIVSRPVFGEGFPIPPIQTTRSDEFYQIVQSPSYDENGWRSLDEDETLYTSWGSMYPTFLSNVGTIEGYEPNNVPRAAIPINSSDYRGEVYLEGAEGEVHTIRWSPNKILLGVNASSDGHVILNQNFYPGWKTRSKGREVTSHEGLIAVNVSSGYETIELYYLPDSFIFGLLVTSVTFLISLVFAWHWTRNKRKRR